MSKTAVVLFNLGGPDSTAAIKPFLFNFFTDPNIIRLPYPFRFLIASLIARRRSRREAGISYGLLGGKSPLLANTQTQAQALERRLMAGGSGEFKTFIAMRYWHPFADAAIAAVKEFKPDRVVLLPLYPQYSTTTTRSSLQDWAEACKRHHLHLPTSTVCCYPFAPGFIESSAELIKTAYCDAAAELSARDLPPPRVLFSAHGLPESIIAAGDPYQWQCIETARRIAAATTLPDLDWQICYQSRVGPKRWLTPSTETALEQAARDGKAVLIYPHAFVSEHVETLVELDQEYREVAHKLGIVWFGRVNTVSVAERFIDGLAEMTVTAAQSPSLTSNERRRLCPQEFSQCCQAEFSPGFPERI